MSKSGGPAGPFSQWERAIAGRYLRARRQDAGLALVAIISFLTIMLSVTVLVVVMSVMNGFRAELLDKMLGFNGHAFVTGDQMNTAARDAMVARLRKVPGVVQATPMIETQAMVIGRGQISGAVVRAVNLADVKATPLVAGTIKEPGSLAGFDVGEDGGDIILMGERLANNMGVHVGDSVQLVSPSGDATAFGSTPQTKDYTVGGVFSAGMSQYDEIYIYMPLRQAQLFFGRDNTIDAVEIKLDDPDKAKALKRDLARAAGPGGQVQDWTERNEAFFNALQVEHVVMRFILLAIVCIASLSIIAGLIMLVKNKQRDIAILRTMGASRGAIMRIFFMSGASLGIAGTAVGVGLASLFCVFIQPIQNFVERVSGTQVFNANVYFLTHLPAKVDWVETAAVAGIAILASFVTTLLPSWLASRIEPVEALRNE
ncbi:lipoprotein-releasing system permease protein [Caulobacter ginsengisoli]|uniref:Lipoprotein-releasing system permease protein n=1 Tax=Caulobacter ginsengisoli TaxID=400775 RepID=A0ABU0ILW3_9CAUL|nr:lipoprotein-releasing ABC transporter permease subunit [Caulobacter ginsengisoli]MDQ0463008.1 lipoprotein-releasing system permease protein [Caulobacter ginsengisoli]